MNFFTVNFIKKLDVDSLVFDNMSEDVKKLLNQFFADDEGDRKLSNGEKIEIFNQIIQMVRLQLKSATTVGQILDILKFSVKMLVVDKTSGNKAEGIAVTTDDILLLKEIFQLMPENFAQDPVKVHLITKAIYETLDGDFGNTMHVLSKIILVNKLGFYVALTLFWALYLSFFEKDSHHYYKMYDRSKFFKLLDSSEGKEYQLEKILHLLMLISIYQNHVILSSDPMESHGIFQEFFKPSASSSNEKDLEKVNKFLINTKALVERSNPVSSKQKEDALMLLEFLEFDLIKGNSEAAAESVNNNQE